MRTEEAYRRLRAIVNIQRKNLPARPLANYTIRVLMKLVVFAHTPPPLHGQSSLYDIECFHVNAQLSKNLKDVGICQKFTLSAFRSSLALALQEAAGEDGRDSQSS